jgi:hypothetical protein
MSDIISRQDALDTLKGFNVVDMISYEHGVIYVQAVINAIYNRLNNLPSVEPDNQVHLCNSCKYDYPECPAEKSDVIFGNSIGHDNICACAKFEIKSERKKGKWKPFDLTWGRNVYSCTACGEAIDIPTEMSKPIYNFCPNCGIDMRGEE